MSHGPSLVAVAAIALLMGGAIPLGLQAQESVDDPVVREQLSLGEAVRLAREYNPDFRIQENQGETAEWRRREAWGSFLPTANASSSLGYTASGERRFQSVQLGTQPAIYSSSYSMGLSLTLTGQSFLQPAVVRDQNAAVQAQIDGASAGLVDQVTQAYLAALEADEQLRQARSEVERTESYVRQAEAQVEVGAGTPLDIRRAELQRGQAEVQLLQAENAAATTRLSLGRILGVEVADDVPLTTAFELFEPELSVEALMAEAMGGNPVLRATRSQQEASRTQARAARTQYLPSVSLSASWTGSVFEPSTLSPLFEGRLQQLSGQLQSCLEDNRIRALLGDPPRDCSRFDVSDPAVEAAARQQVRDENLGFPFDYRAQPVSFSMNVSIPVFTGFSRQLQLEEARVSERNAREQVRSEELRLRAEVETVVRTVNTAFRTVALQTRNRETAAEELRLAQERFRLGLASSIEVVDAQANLSQAERDEISAVYNFHSSFAGLEALVGQPLR